MGPSVAVASGLDGLHRPGRGGIGRTVLRLDQLCLAYGSKDLFVDLDWRLERGDRIGLVGANGVGKSSLLKVINGELRPDAGQVIVDRGVRVGYLPQEGLKHAGRSLVDEAMSGMVTLRALEERMRRAMARVEALPPQGADHAEALAEHEQAEAAFRTRGGYAMEAQVGRVLRGLGFLESDQARDCVEFSGGWQMRIALAKLLLEAPEVLLLDEPTNHLDIESRTWLEHFLGEYPGAVVLVSHDRTFLDRVGTRVCELSRGALDGYTGSFTQYLAERSERLERLRKAYQEQQEEIRRVELFIRRFRAKATKATQVQSRVKALEKLERVDLPPTEERIRFRFAEASRCGPWPLTVRQGNKAYGEIRVLEGIDLTVGRGERVALVGPNGAGKSTLLRLLAGREPFDAGELVCDPHVRVAFFAQDQAEELEPEGSVLDAVRSALPGVELSRVRNTLGAFLFRGDDVHKRCEVLSGGERNRVALVRILLQRANVLLLDEPTNHLDLQGKEALQDALRAWDGSVVFVSHDRDFVQEVATAVVEVGGGRAERHDMRFEDFLWKRALELGFQGVHSPGLPGPDLWFLRGTEYFKTEDREKASEGKRNYAERKKSQRRLRALRREVLKLEQASERAGLELEQIDARMMSPELARDHGALMELQQERDRLVARNRELADAWESSLEEFEGLREELEDSE
jgi:ATP-binding cassette subfamily F protein 3